MAPWRVRLLPEDRVVEVPDGGEILAAAEAQGVPLPSSCLEGSCTTCLGRLLDGRVEQDRALALTEAQKQRGYVLLCVALARSDCVIRTHCMHEL